ncbi:MAG TPA: zinc-binding dehydrogenase [Actinomycetota bacterium]|nr:zinc-binding dehydrogenase [Actinomycetota bacterium]
MRAAILTRARTIEVREVPDPEPGPGDVRLRVRYCGLCGSDRMLYSTGALAGPTTVLGHEISAVVDLDPTGALPAGTRVVPYPARGCGECLWCRDGEPSFCLAPPRPPWAGGLAELVCYPAGNLIPIPSDVDDRTAALAEPLGVAIRAVEASGAGSGDLAYVSGLGSIGSLVVAALVALGCRVVGGDPREERRRLATELGCEVVLDPTAEDAAEAVFGIDPRGARVVLECAGVVGSLQQVFEVCGPRGTVGIVGVPTGPVLLLRMTVREQRAFSIAGPSPATMRRALELLRARPGIARVITGVVPLGSAGEALAGLAAGHGGVKVLVAPGG